MKQSAPALLSQFIQIDTSTTKGNERSGLLFIQSLAESFGLYTYFHETAPSKGNLIIALRKDDLRPFYDEVFFYQGQKKGTPFPNEVMVLLSHVDVVDANPEGWTYPPFSGEIVEGEVWGRGAIDAKQIGIVHLLTMNNLKNINSAISLIQVITSEEEYGSENGLKRLLHDYPFLWENAVIWNEGGGFPIQVQDTLFYLVETGQKGNMSFTVTLQPKESANPYLPSNRTDLMAFQIAESLSCLKVPGEKMQPSVSRMFELMSKKLKICSSSERNAGILEQIPNNYARMFSAMTYTTFTVTSIRGGKKDKELSGAYKISVDVRPLPNTELATVKNLVEQTINIIDPSTSVEWHSMNAGYDQELLEETRCLLEDILKDGNVEATVVPFMTIGSNDGKYFQERQAKVLGYCPMTPEMTFDRVLPLVHGINERIATKDLEFGIDQLTAIIKHLSASMKGEMEYER